MSTVPHGSLGLIAFGLLGGLALAQPPSTLFTPAAKNYARLPLAFEKTGERFVARGDGYAIGIESGKAVLAVARKDVSSSHAISLEFAGSKPARAVPETELPGKVNYIRGNDPRKWQIGLPTYARVAYPDTYPGIDVVYYGNQRQLEFDLVVKPGADPDAIRLRVAGAGKLSIDGAGALAMGDLKIALPKIYQEIGGTKQSVAGRFAITGRDEVVFRIDAWDRTRELVIDPTIVYSALLGGGLGSSTSAGIALDPTGNIVVAGYTFAADFPTLDAAQTLFIGNADAFVTKLNPAGTELIYSTYLGGTIATYAYGLAVDSTGAAWVTGATFSSDFPLVNPAQGTFEGSAAAFVTRLDTSGVVQFSTYLAGSSAAIGYGIAVDGSNHGYVTGYASGTFPTTAHAFQQSSGQNFVTKYTAAGAVVYSTLLGSTGTRALAIAADSSGNAYVTGVSHDTTFPGAPTGGAQSANGGNGDAFVAKLNASGSALDYFTFLGGAQLDQGAAIAVDKSGDAYITGQTSSTGLATTGAAQTAFGGAVEGFAAELNPSGKQFLYVTYLGGGRANFLNALALDGLGNVYVAGYTDAIDFPTATPLQPTLPGNGISLYQSTDSGATWAAFDSNIPDAVLNISLNPAGNSAVVVTPSGIYRTANNGASWSKQLSGQFVGSAAFLARSPVMPGTIYAAGNSGEVYQSTDDGITWKEMGGPPVDAQSIVADPLAANTLYWLVEATGLGTSPYLFKSTDGGATWNALTTGLPNAQVASLAAASDGSLYAAINGNGFGVYKSTNQGASWSAVNTGLPSGGDISGAQSLSASGTTVYLLDFADIYATTNGGAGWAALPPLVVDNASVGVQGIAASPQDASVLFVNTAGGGVMESTDGGSTLHAVGAGLPSNSSLLLVPDPGNSANVFAVDNPVNQAAMVAKLNSTGSALTWSTYLGGSVASSAQGVATDGMGNVFVTGNTAGSAGFPITSTALPAGGAAGIFITKISDSTADCSISVNPGGVITALSGPITFSVVAPSGCPWTASTNEPWAVISSGASGTGSGVITVQAPINSGDTTQSATLTVGNQNVTITQPASSCNYQLENPGIYTVPAAGGTLTVVMTVGAGCPWVVTNSYSSAVSLTSPSSGTGSATISATVTANPGFSPRLMYLSVGNANILITQTSGSVSVATTSAPDGAVGVYYATALAANEGFAPYNWTVASGSLPPGLTLNASTGIISGYPTTIAGSPFSFMVTAQDSAGNESAPQSLEIAIGPFATFPGQSEVQQVPASSAVNALLFPFVTNQPGSNTEITIANTTADLSGASPAVGTCTVDVYGTGAPEFNTGIAMPGGQLAFGGTRVWTLSDIAPGFAGYAMVACTFPLARGSARVLYNLGEANATSFSEEAQVLTLPQSIPATQSFLLPYVTNQNGFDTNITIANTSTAPPAVPGATPTSGSCTLSFYGAGAPAPSTGVAAPGGTQASGTSLNFPLSSVAPGFEGYAVVQCNYGAAAAFAYLDYDGTQNGGFTVSETPEVVALPRSVSPQPLLFSSLTNQNGNDTTIAIANTSADPFGTTATAGACALNLYGTNAPGSPFVTPSIAAGTVYTTTISAIAPGFVGYATASCPFGPARGFAYVAGTVPANDYSESAEVLAIPRDTSMAILFPSASNQGGHDTNVTISNTSDDPFGTPPVSGTCRIFYYGSGNGGPNPSFISPASSNIPAGGQLVFTISAGNPAEGIPGLPGFQGYIIASCGFPLARGVASEALTQTIAFAPLGTVALGSGSFALSATASSGLPVTLTSNSTTVCTVSGANATPVATGICSITASQPGGANYAAATSVTQTFLVLKPQTVTFAALPNKLLGTAPFALKATASSALPVTFASNSLSNCTVSGVNVTLLSGGTCSITASQAGNATYAAAPTVTETFTVLLTQTISFGPLSNQTLGATPPMLSATAGPDLVVAFASNSKTICTVSGVNVTLAAGGICSITASQAGNPEYAAAAPVTQTFLVLKPQTITFAAPMNPTLGAKPFALKATSTSALAVAFASNSQSICTMSGVDVTLVSGGSCSITANQAGNTIWAAATPVTQTFTVLLPQTITFGPLSNQPLGTAPFNLTASSNSNLAVAFASTTQAICTVSEGAVTLVAAGKCSITASQSGDNTTYAAAPSVTQSFTVQKTQTITFGPLANQTLGTAPPALKATATSALAVTFASNTASICAVSGTTVKLVSGGTCSITASQTGSAAFAAAPTVTQTFTVLLPQTITFPSPGKQTLGTAPFPLIATVNSNLAVQFASNSQSICTVSSGNVTLVAGGTCSITASLGGNGTYAAAAPVTQTFTIFKPQTITFNALSNQPLGEKTLALSATSNSGLAVAFATNSKPVCTVSGVTLTLVAIGTCSITASQAGNTAYAPASPVTQSFTVLEAQTITFPNPGTQGFGTGTVTLSAMASSGLGVTFASNSQSICTVSGTTLTLVIGGTCSITASQPGNGTFAPAISVTQTFPVLQGQTIIFNPLGNETLGTGPFALSATSNSTLPVTFSSNSKTICTVSGVNVTLVAGGTCSITASQAGNATWAPAAVTQTFVVLKSQSISFATPNNETERTGPYALTASATSGLVVTFASNSQPTCTVSGPFVTLVTFGTCSITASQSGNSIYASAPSITQTFTVLETQTISFPAPSNEPLGTGPWPLSATATSNVPVVLTSNSKTICTVSGANVTLLAGGTCSITASQPGNATFAAASPVTQTFFVLKSQTINFSAPGSQLLTTSSITVGATATSGLGVAFASNNPLVCTVSNVNVVSLLTAGTCSLTASQSGNTIYAAAASVTQTFLVSQASQTITFNQPGNQPLGTSPYALTATASSGLGVTLTSNSTGICTVSGFTITLAAGGPCSITASQSGTTVYAAATPVTRIFTVIVLTPQTITFDTIPNPLFGISPFPLAAQSNALLPVIFTSNTPTICKISDDLLTLLSAGTCSITASQAGSISYDPASVTQSSITVSTATGATSFVQPMNSPFTVGASPVSLTAGYFNGDSNLDLAVVNQKDGTVTVLRGDGWGNFAADSPLSAGANPSAVVVGDFNGDGIPDLAVANTAGSIALFPGNKSGGFTTTNSSAWPFASSPSSLAAGDFNGDGIQDLAATGTSSNTVEVLLGNGSRGFTAANNGIPYPVSGSSPLSVAVGDFNGDGFEDLVIANFASTNNLTVLLGQGSGGFKQATGSPFTYGKYAAALVVGDFNRDGKPDLAIASWGSFINPSAGSVTVLLGNGAGGFAQAVGSPFTVGKKPQSLAVGDFNGDGNPDLAIANSGDNSVTILLGAGNTPGTLFSEAMAMGSPISVGTTPYSIAVGDFNGDGIEDFATANAGDGTVTVMLGTIP